MHSPTNSAAVREMFDRIAPTYNFLNRVLSFGTNVLWERLAVRTIPKECSGVCLDLCTGTGALVPLLARRFSRVVAADISPQMLAIGRARFKGLTSVEWVETDAQAMVLPDATFDAITISYGVRNFPDRLRGLREMLRVAKPGACLVVLEFGQPTSPLWRMLFATYSRIVIPAVGRCISGNREAYEYLPATSATFPCGERFEQLLRDGGWLPQKTRALSGGIAYVYLATKPI